MKQTGTIILLVLTHFMIQTQSQTPGPKIGSCQHITLIQVINIMLIITMKTRSILVSGILMSVTNVAGSAMRGLGTSLYLAAVMVKLWAVSGPSILSIGIAMVS